jgi:transposase InsO family protein
MIYKFMVAHEGEFKIERMGRVLGVGRSGYYAWRSRPASQRAKANDALLEKIQAEYETSRATYGSPRIHAALQRQGVRCSRKRVARLMQLHQIRARTRKKRRPTTTQREAGAIPAPNLLNQEFSAPAPNQKWVSDITYIDTAEGWLYLAPVLDLYSRRVVGWAMADHMEASLVEDALKMALRQRQPQAGWLHHSDQGRQYTSQTYQDMLQASQCQISMSRVGNCFDNAVMESFFRTLKTECATEQFASRSHARSAIFEYMEAWYNRQRLHSYLGYLSPVEFERNSGH